MNYRRDIDGLRALAVVPVILFHAGFQFVPGGFVGVDVFFVISGYLITRLLVADLQRGSFSLIQFYERRARRILPALFLVLSTSLPFAALLLSPRDLKDYFQALVAAVLSFSNVLFWLKTDYFEPAAEYNSLLHTWSLGVEEQFYIFFPLLVSLLLLRSMKGLLLVLMTGAICSFVASHLWLGRDSMAVFYLLPFRAWELLSGSLAALATYQRSMPSSLIRWRGVLATLGAGGLLVANLAFDKEMPFPGVWALLPVIGTVLLIVFGGVGTVVGTILSSRVLVGIGLVSYSAYLWHVPIFAFARNASIGEPSVNVMFCLVVAVFGLSWWSWKYVEVPCRNPEVFTRVRTFKYAAFGSFVFVLLGLAGHFSNGFENLKVSEAHRGVMATAVSSPFRARCHSEGAAYPPMSESCRYHNGPARSAVFGDSHAVELAYAFADGLAARGESITHYSFSGCVPTHGRLLAGALGPCSRWTDEALSHIASSPEIVNVVVIYRIHSALFGDHAGVYPAQPSAVDEGERHKRWRSLVSSLEMLIRAQKNVILVLQAPELPKPIDDLVLRSNRPMALIQGIERKWWDERRQYVQNRIHEIPLSVKVVDPTSIFCNKEFCTAAAAGEAFYFDDDHLSLAGAKKVVDVLLNIYDLPSPSK